METLHLNSFQHSLFLLAFLIQFSSSPQFSSLGYVPQDTYFINCGSDTDVTANDQVYIGELDFNYPGKSFSNSTKENTVSSLVPSPLYQTARVFRSPSWYEFSTVTDRTYLVRLHFFAFSSPTNLSAARFNVSVPGFWLLQYFNAGNATDNSVLVKEFFVKTTRNTFNITFTPLASSLAFVNAIELLDVLPLRLITDKVARFSYGLGSRVLETKHRLNVGGQTVTNDNDTLLRNWLPDDGYVTIRGNAKNVSFNGTIVFIAADYSDGPNSNQYTAPNDVYQTAKEVNATSTSTNSKLNITWSLPVDKNTDHLLRLHFCDIFNPQSRLTMFLVYIYDTYVFNANDDTDVSATLPAPYYYDFVVRSDNSGLLKISIAPNASDPVPIAFLNGLEIMKVIEPSSSVPLDDSDSKSKTRITIAITVPVVAVILVLVIICIYLRVIKRKQKDPTRKVQLNWEKRYNIIQGIARGLLYLHEDSRLRIIHRDVKASNILLDSEMNPKISDFGLARLFVINQTQEITGRIVGTRGYMAPEYLMHGQFSVKSDVFSFGVLVLEIISGQKNSTTIRHGEDVESLLTFAWRNWREGTITNIIDTSLNIISQNEMMRCIHIGLLCVQENLADRPTMAIVALMLNSYLLTLSAPSKPAFVMDSRIGSLPDMQLWDDNSGAKRSIESLNKASITDPYPR